MFNDLSILSKDVTEEEKGFSVLGTEKKESWAVSSTFILNTFSMKVIRRFVFVILLDLFRYTNAASVRKVFYGGSPPRDVSCKIFQPNYGIVDLKSPVDAIQLELRNLVLDYYRPPKFTNCTTDYGNVGQNMVKTSRILPNGSYDGFIGMIQRNEYDMVIFGMRLDLLRNDPGIIGPAIGPADAIIGVGKYHDDVIKANIFAMMDNFDHETIAFIFISFYIFCFVLFFVESVLENPEHLFTRRLSVIKLFKNVLNTFCKLMANFLGYESFDSWSVTARLLMITALFFNILISSGFFKNLVKSDMSVVRPAKQINSIEELLRDKEFKNVQPIYVKQLYMPELLASSEEKIFQELRNKIAMNKSFSELDFDFENDPFQTMKMLFAYTKHIEDHEAAILLPGLGIEVMHKFLCSFHPEKLVNVTLAKKRFAEGIFVHLFSKKINPRIRKFLHYQLETITEMAIYPGLEHYTRSQDFAYSFSRTDPITQSRCEFLRYPGKKDDVVVAYTIDNFVTPLFKLFFDIYEVCFLVFFGELLFYRGRLWFIGKMKIWKKNSRKKKVFPKEQSKEQQQPEKTQNPYTNVEMKRKGVRSEYIVKQNISIVYNPPEEDGIQVIEEDSQPRR